MPDYPIVLVQWTDTICNTQWRHDEDVDEWARNQKWVVSDVGYLLRETDEYIILAGTWAKAEGQFKNLSKIPKAWAKIIPIAEYVRATEAPPAPPPAPLPR